MKMTRILLAAALAVATTTPLHAMCSGEEHVMSCAEGYVYDAETKACVQQLSG